MMSRARSTEKFNPVLAMHTAHWSTGYFSLAARGAYSKNFTFSSENLISRQFHDTFLFLATDSKRAKVSLFISTECTSSVLST